MDVVDVMTRVVKTCRPEQRLDEIAQLLWDGDVGALPVTDADGRPLAVITDRDLCMAAYTQGQPLHALRVALAMSRTLYTCHANDRVTAAERTMRLHRVRRLPVVDDSGRLVGVLTLSDITRARLALPASDRARDLLVDVAVTLSDICRAAAPTQPPAAQQPQATPARASASLVQERVTEQRESLKLRGAHAPEARLGSGLLLLISQ